MKTLKLISTVIGLFFAVNAMSQVSVNVSVGIAPMWGPVGYSEASYYYLPDVEAYYDLQTSMFVYYDGGVWVHRNYLPTMYKNYDLYSGYKVVLGSYRGKNPYMHFNDHKMKYKKGYRGKKQNSIGKRPNESHQ